MAKGEYLGEFEQLILLAVLRLGAEAYGMPIRREIEECTGRSAAIGAVYATLDRLESKGLIASREGEGTAERGGRAKRFFKATPAGLSALTASQRAVRSMMKGLKLSEEGI